MPQLTFKTEFLQQPEWTLAAHSDYRNSTFVEFLFHWFFVCDLSFAQAFKSLFHGARIYLF
jgi:hypothetical protein